MKSYRDNRDSAKDARAADTGVATIDRVLRPQIQGGLSH